MHIDGSNTHTLSYTCICMHAHTRIYYTCTHDNDNIQFHGTISLEFSAGHSKKCTNTVSIQIAAKNLVCPGLPVESEEICVCVWQLNVDRERGKGESMRDLGKKRRHGLGR